MLATYKMDPNDVAYFSFFFDIIKTLECPLEAPCRSPALSLSLSLSLSLTSRRPQKSRILVLDLDETLVHAEDDFDLCPSPTNTSKFTLRPGLDTFLRTMAQHYELVVFTASTPRHADALLAAIEQHGRYFSGVLYRDSCTCLNGYYVKDLRVLGECRELKDIVQVDDSLVAMAFNLDNGIVVKPYLGESEDRELEVLGSYLLNLASEPDVRVTNASTFGLSKLKRILSILNSNA